MFGWNIAGTRKILPNQSMCLKYQMYIRIDTHWNMKNIFTFVCTQRSNKLLPEYFWISFLCPWDYKVGEGLFILMGLFNLSKIF